MIRACVVVENHPAAVMGGAQYQAHLLAEELASRPDVTVTYLARRTAHDGHGITPSYDVRSIGCAAGIRRRAVFFDSRGLWRALHELQPDVIYQRMKQSYTGVCALYSRKASVPFFFQVASDGDLDPRWARHRLSTNLPFDLVEGMVGNWGLRHATHVITQTRRQDRLLRERFERNAVEVVRNFQALPASLPEKGGSPLEVLWVGNFKDVKRPQLFVELAQRFAGRSDLKFVMVGRPAQHRRFAPLMSLVQQLPNLECLGFLPLEEVNGLMARAAIHVNTSRFEGFPNTFIQAWGRGAIVASLVVDVDEGMEAGGIGFCTGTLERLESVIDELARAPERRRTIVERAFRYVHEHHALSNAGRLADRLVAAATDAARKADRAAVRSGT